MEGRDKVMAECDPNRFSLYEIFFKNMEDKCLRLYHDDVIDPLWEVKPTKVSQQAGAKYDFYYGSKCR